MYSSSIPNKVAIKFVDNAPRGVGLTCNCHGPMTVHNSDKVHVFYETERN